MVQTLSESLREFLNGSSIIGAALISHDGMVIGSASNQPIDSERLAVLIGIFTARSTNKGGFRLIRLPAVDHSRYVAIASLEDANLVLVMNDLNIQLQQEPMKEKLLKLKVTLQQQTS